MVNYHLSRWNADTCGSNDFMYFARVWWSLFTCLGSSVRWSSFPSKLFDISGRWVVSLPTWSAAKHLASPKRSTECNRWLWEAQPRDHPRSWCRTLLCRKWIHQKASTRTWQWAWRGNRWSVCGSSRQCSFRPKNMLKELKRSKCLIVDGRSYPRTMMVQSGHTLVADTAMLRPYRSPHQTSRTKRRRLESRPTPLWKLNNRSKTHVHRGLDNSRVASPRLEEKVP